jgi:hypothetical protein
MKHEKKLTKWPKRHVLHRLGRFHALLGLQMCGGWAVGDVVE